MRSKFTCLLLVIILYSSCNNHDKHQNEFKVLIENIAEENILAGEAVQEI